MQYISERNTYVRCNRHLAAHCPGHKLRKARRQSVDTDASYYLENPDGSIVDNIELEDLARRLGCLCKNERVGVPRKRTEEEVNALFAELANNIAAGRVYRKR